MAQLIEQPARKADTPRSAHEQRIATAKAGMAAGDALWRSNAAVSGAPAPATPAQHLSGMGASTITGIAPQSNARKADVLADLPQEARRRAEHYGDGAKKFLALLYQRHAKTGQPVEFTSRDAAVVMDLPMDRAAKAVEVIEQAGLIKRRFNSLGGLAGYVPGLPA